MTFAVRQGAFDFLCSTRREHLEPRNTKDVKCQIVAAVELLPRQAGGPSAGRSFFVWFVYFVVRTAVFGFNRGTVRGNSHPVIGEFRGHPRASATGQSSPFVLFATSGRNSWITHHVHVLLFTHHSTIPLFPFTAPLSIFTPGSTLLRF